MNSINLKIRIEKSIRTTILNNQLEESNANKDKENSSILNMRRYNQENDNRFYAYLTSGNSGSSKNSSSNSTNRNAHYQYYNPRLRAQQQTQRTLFEYQYSNASANRTLPALYGSGPYQPPPFLDELPPSSTNSIADLGEPISIFHDFEPIERQRSLVVPALTSSYVPPDPTRRPSASDIRLATAQAVREQMLTDIQHTINDIDRELTSLERRPSGPRYMPPRFSPIIELDNQDDHPLRPTTTTIQPASVSAKKLIPIITSPTHNPSQQKSAHTVVTRERNSGGSQMWPNKPKRVYQVIPSLTSDSKKTSRQSSVGALHESVKITEIQSPQSPPKTSGKHLSISSIQFNGQYHYGPEVEEVEILSNDPENTDHRSTYDEIQEGNTYETLSTNQFLRETSATPHNRAVIFVPEFGGQSELGYHESTEDFTQNNPVDTNTARSVSATSFHDLTPAKEVSVQNTQSLIKTAPEKRVEAATTPRIASGSTNAPEELYHQTQTDLTNQSNPTIHDGAKPSHPITTTTLHTRGDLLRKPSPLSKANPDPTTIVPLPPLPPHHPAAEAATPASDKNVGGLVAYFFSDYGNEGDGEEDIISIDHNNFAVPTGAEILADDDMRSSIIAPSQASLLILHSAHVPSQQQQQQQQQQQFTPTKPSAIENNNERIKVEEKKEKGSVETDATNKRISIATSILPSSPLPPKQVFPTSIIDDTRTQLTKNNNPNHDQHHQQSPPITPLNMNTTDSTDLPIRPYSSSSSRTSQKEPHIPLPPSDGNDESIEKTNEETPRMLSNTHTPLQNIYDDERLQTPKRRQSVDQRIKSSSRPSSRTPSATSNYGKKDEEITPIDSPTKTSLKNIDRENSTSRRSISRQPSIAPSEETYSSERRSRSHRSSSSRNHQIDLPYNQFPRDQSNTSIDDPQTTPTNDNEPNVFTVQSEHFLRNQSQSPSFDLNQRLPSGYSASQPNESRRSSAASSTVPVVRNSPDFKQNQSSTSRAATPRRKLSITSIDLPSDPNTLLTTTDEPDPYDPSIMQSTIHFRMLSSQQPSTASFVPDRDEPSPLENLLPVYRFPSPVHTKELPTEIQLHQPPSIKHHSPTNKIEVKSKNESPEIGFGLPSPKPSHHEHENASFKTSSPVKHEHQPASSPHSPLLSYPARLEELMRSTSPPINELEIHNRHHPLHQPVSPTVEHHHIHIAPKSPPHDESSSTHHTSIEGDDADRQQLDTPLLSPTHERHRKQENHTNNHQHTSKHALLPPAEPTFITQQQQRLSSEKSGSSAPSDHVPMPDTNLYRNDVQLSSASIRLSKSHFSPPPIRNTSAEHDMPTLTPSQLHSKLSLRAKHPRKKSIKDEHLLPTESLSPLPQTDRGEITSMNNDENPSEEKAKQRRQRRRVSFSSSLAHFQTVDRQLYSNWRERVAAILASKRRPHEKYAHVQSRVNSFANFEYQPKKITILPKRKSHPKTNEQPPLDGSKFIKRKKFKVKKPPIRQEIDVEDQTDEEPHANQSAEGPAPQLFGRLWCLPDGSPTVFHEALEWNAPSKLKVYSYENIHYEPHRNEFKVFNRKPRWHSESKLVDLLKESPRTIHRQTLVPATSLPLIVDQVEPYLYQPPTRQALGSERKIFDIQTNTQQQAKAKIQSDNISHDSRPSDVPVFDEKPIWIGKSRLKDTTWGNVNYQPKKSKVQIFHKTVHWNSEPKIRTRSPSTVHASRTSMSNVHIFDEKLNWDAQAKIHCWSEIDLRQLTKKKSIFAQYRDPKWNDIVTARVDASNYNYPKLAHNVEIFSDRLSWTRSSGLKDYVWENYDYRSHPRTRRSNKQQHSQDIEQTPPNRPKWNSVSKTRSVNSIYNPNVPNANVVRRGWDRDLRRKRVQKLPPLKRKRQHEEVPQLAIDAPPSNGQLAIDYNYDHASTTQGRTTSNGYGTTSSRRSSKALVPLNHNPMFSQLELPMDTPRSQRPVQQEWYEELNKSRLTHRTDMGRTTNHSHRRSIDSLHHPPTTPKDLPTFRSSTRNSQNSGMSSTLLDSSIKSNRTTEFRLSKDMDEHHHHSHTPYQSMPIEIRGFKLEGTQLSVPDHATIRPLSNVNYGASERVKSRRVYPWSSLHPHGTSSRNSSLVPIAEFRPPSLDTTINESQALIQEEQN